MKKGKKKILYWSKTSRAYAIPICPSTARPEKNFLALILTKKINLLNGTVKKIICLQ